MTNRTRPLVPLLMAFLCAAPFLASAQSASAKRDLNAGIEQFKNAQYDKAILLFNNVVLDPGAGPLKPDAYLLLAKSNMAIGRLDDAGRSLDFYLANYPDAVDYPEALYQKGRLLFMKGDFESSLPVIQGFLAKYPKSTFVPSAWFWAGESLYGLGRLDDAATVYTKIVTDYPSSVKVEAAQYRLSLIQISRKEAELAKLLKWSHEDFLRSVEEYQNRERVYQQSIEAYQKRLAGTGVEDDQKTIADLRLQLAAKTDELRRLQTQVSSLGAAATTASPAAPSAESVRRERLLAAKEAALALKEQYLAALEPEGGNAQ